MIWTLRFYVGLKLDIIIWNSASTPFIIIMHTMDKILVLSWLGGGGILMLHIAMMCDDKIT